MIDHYIYIKTKVRDKDKFLVKLYKNNISVYDTFSKNQILYLKIKYEDYQKIQEEMVNTKFDYVKDTGVFGIKNIINPFKVMIIVFFLFFVNFFNQMIVSVEVIHSNKAIRELVRSSLEDYGIKPGSFRKDFNKLEEIKSKIIDSYKDQIEWLEIERIGMKYVVRIEERIINHLENNTGYCHIVASKSGIIHSIRSTKGEILVQNGQYVKEGERLISGEISFNEEVKNNVCAQGNAFAEVWYTTNVSLPKKYQETTRTGKMRYNLLVGSDKKDYKIFRSRLENYETEKKKLFSFLNFTVYILKEYEIHIDEKEYSEEDGVNKALLLADEKMNVKLKEGESISSRKVLKKSINDSTIDIEVFYAIIENITKYEEYSVEEEGS